MTLVRIDWLSMVLRLRQHNIGYTADGFYRSDDPTNSVKGWLVIQTGLSLTMLTKSSGEETSWHKV